MDPGDGTREGAQGLGVGNGFLAPGCFSGSVRNPDLLIGSDRSRKKNTGIRPTLRMEGAGIAPQTPTMNYGDAD